MAQKRIPLILAMDIGTSSLRCALFDLEAKRLKSTTVRQTYRLHRASDGTAELAPTTLWRAALTGLARCMESHREGSQSRRFGEILGVGISCFWHSLVGVDERGRALTPIYTWADSRCQEQARRLRDEFSEEQIQQRTGCMLRVSYWPAKLIWLQETRGRLFEQTRHWMSPAEWLQLGLCGRTFCSYGMATGTGLFNPNSLQWDERLLRHCRLAEHQLSPLGEETVTLLPQYARRFPQLGRCRWWPAVGDGATSNLGSGATTSNLAAINIGTSAALRLMRRGPNAIAPFGLFCYRVDQRRYLVGGALSNAGNLRDWCRENLRLPAGEDELQRRLVTRPTSPHGLTALPFLLSERAPTWCEDLKGAIVGLSQSTTSEDIFSAMTEAVYHRLAYILDLLSQDKNRKPRLVVSGGIQRSQFALQRLANVLGRPLLPSGEPEASLRGAAVYVLEKLGYRVAPPEFGTAIRPQPGLAREYARQRKRQKELEELLSSMKGRG